jgi:hypothetical protein
MKTPEEEEREAFLARISAMSRDEQRAREDVYRYFETPTDDVLVELRQKSQDELALLHKVAEEAAYIECDERFDDLVRDIECLQIERWKRLPR